MTAVCERHPLAGRRHKGRAASSGPELWPLEFSGWMLHGLFGVARHHSGTVRPGPDGSVWVTHDELSHGAYLITAEGDRRWTPEAWKVGNPMIEFTADQLEGLRGLAPGNTPHVKLARRFAGTLVVVCDGRGPFILPAQGHPFPAGRR